MPLGWVVDKNGNETSKPEEIRGILPLGGSSEVFGGHKGFGLALMVDIMTAVLSGGTVYWELKGYK